MKIARTQLKHQRVEAEIRRLVQNLPIGAKLPAERDLADNYNCNFLTVRKALKQMVDDGSIVRRVGSGTFVAKNEERSTPGRTGKAVGMLVCNESNAYAFRVVQAVVQAGQEQAVDVRSGWVRDFSDEAMAQVLQFQKDGCVALTLPWFPHEKAEEVRTFVHRCPLPVSIAMLIPGLERNCFTQPDIFGTSTSEAIESLCHYFSLLGRKRIALLGPDSASDVLLQKRLSAYACFTSRENLPSLCGLVGPGAQAMDQLAERWKIYQGDLGIISYDDEHALRFMTAMHKLGLSAPEDYNIIGYNDTEGSRYSDPPLSTIHQNFDHIGQWMLKSALALAQGETCQSPENPRPIMLVRDTCGGRERIDDALREQLPEIDISVDENDHSPESAPAAELAS